MGPSHQRLEGGSQATSLPSRGLPEGKYHSLMGGGLGWDLPRRGMRQGWQKTWPQLVRWKVGVAVVRGGWKQLLQKSGTAAAIREGGREAQGEGAE